MCLLSSSSTHRTGAGGGSNPGLIFDVKRKSMCLDHKFTTADKSQVCDGRNWEKFRLRSGRTKDDDDGSCSTTSRSSGPDGSRVEMIKSRVGDMYRPVSSRSLGKEDRPQQQQERPSPPRQHRQDDKDQARRSPTSPEEMQATERDESSASAPKEEEAAPRTSQRDLWDGPPADPPRNTDGSNRRRSSSSSRRRSSATDSGGDDGSYRRTSSDGTSSRRRHSYNNEYMLPKEQRLQRPKGKKPSRHLSVDGSTASSDPKMSGARVTMRKLSEPMHRCTLTNSSVSGIMRPARYSSNNLAAMATARPSVAEPADPPAVPAADGEKANARPSSIGGAGAAAAAATGGVRRNFSLLNLSSELMPGLNDRTESSLMSRSSSAEDFHHFVCTNQKTMRRGGQLEELGDAKWVASGVNFSRKMEVYLFKT